jgi:hypothetical protein
LAQLREHAEEVGIRGHEEMSADQLRKATAVRRRCVDPHQAEIVARRRGGS